MYKLLRVSLLAMLLCDQSMLASTGVFSKVSGGSGRFKFYMAASSLMRKKQVSLTTKMTTVYKAAYAYAPENAPTFVGNFLVDRPAVNANAVLPLLGDNLAIQRLTLRLFPAPLVFLMYGTLPTEWAIAPVGGNWPAYDPQGNAHNIECVQATREIMERAMFYPEDDDDVPADRAWLPSETYRASAESTDKYAFDSYGVRVELGFGVRILKKISILFIGSYNISFEKKDKARTKTGLEFVTQGEQTFFKAVDRRTTLSTNLIAASFKEFDGKIASGLKATLDIKDTLGLFTGLDCSLSDSFALTLKLGVRKAEISVCYEEGAMNIPRTSEAIYQVNDPALKRINLKERKLHAVEYPLVFGLDASLVMCKLHRLFLGVEYSSYTANLCAQKHSDSDNNEPAVIAPQLEHMLKNVAAQDGSVTVNERGYTVGLMQFAPSEIQNELTAQASVQDLTFVAGYSLVV